MYLLSSVSQRVSFANQGSPMSGALAGSAGVGSCGLSASSQIARTIHMVEAGVRENKQQHRRPLISSELAHHPFHDSLLSE